MKLGKFRETIKQLEKLPDDTDLMVFDAFNSKPLVGVFHIFDNNELWFVNMDGYKIMSSQDGQVAPLALLD